MPNFERDSKALKLKEYDHSYWLDIYDYYQGKSIDTLVNALYSELDFKGHEKLAKSSLRFVLTELRIAASGAKNRYLVYPRGKEQWNQYSSWPNPNRVSYKCVEVIDTLITAGYVEGVVGFKTGAYARRARCRSTKKLTDLFTRHDVQRSIGQHPETPVIWVTDDDHQLVKMTPSMRKALVSTEAILDSYNELMEEVEVSAELSLRSWNPSMEHRKILYRSFKNDLDKEGRFYGPWWQSMPKVQRKHILIDGKPTVELDFVCQALNLLYGYYGGVSYQETKGSPNPPADGYVVEGLPREFAKLMFTVLLGASSRKNAWAGLRKAIHDKFEKAETNQSKKIEGADRDRSEALEWQLLVQSDAACEELYQKFVSVHPVLEPYLTQALSLSLMNIDSTICEYVVSKLTKEKVPVLTIHDSFIVKEEDKNKLAQAMKDAYQIKYKDKSLSLAYGGIKVSSLKGKNEYLI